MSEQKLYLSREEAAEFLTAQGYPTAKATLARYATGRRHGPLFRKWGKIPVYTKEDLLTWAQERTKTSEEYKRDKAAERNGAR